jgi:hypothetical protein
MRNVDVYADQSGNALIAGRDTALNPISRLVTSTGEWLDYTPFFNDQMGMVRGIMSRDFKRNLVICHSRGLVLHEVALTGAIDQYLIGEPIRTMTQTGDGTVFVTTQGKPTYRLNLNKGTVLPETEIIPGPKVIVEEDRGKWISHIDGLALTDPSISRIEYVFEDVGRIIEFGRIDANHLALIGPDERLYKFNTRDRISELIQVGEQPVRIDGLVHDIYSGDGRILWIASSTGLWKIDITNHTLEVLGPETGFTDARFICIHPGDDGRLWLGTFVGGIQIFDPVSGKIEVLDSDHGLPNNTIVSITRDIEGVRWVATYKGVSMVTADGKLIANLSVEDGLVHSENNRYASLMMDDGRILIGSVSGLNVIDPMRVKAYFKSARDLQSISPPWNFLPVEENWNGSQNLICPIKSSVLQFRRVTDQSVYPLHSLIFSMQRA